VANSLAAIRAGVDQVEGAINGIVERAGNAALEEVVMALYTRQSYYQVTTTIRPAEIARTSRLVSKLTGMSVPANKAIVGANAFAHESGIHQDGMLKHQETYEIIRPETVGFSQTKLVLGKHSGRHAFRERLEALGYSLSDERINALFVRFKELADRKKTLTDEDLIALAEEKQGEVLEIFELESIQLSYGNHALPTASLRLRNRQTGEEVEEAACGSGSIDAIFKAIDRATGEEVELLDYKVASNTQGTDALGEGYVQLRQGEMTVQGRGVSTDVLEASARAYIDAINRLLTRKQTKHQDASLNAVLG
jgi:2-isopropylmalate synthase